MDCVSALSTAADSAAAIDEVLGSLRRQGWEEPADLTIVFSTPHHADELHRFSARFIEELGTQGMLGCTAEAVIGGGRELEDEPGLVVWAVRSLPGSACRPVRLAEPGEGGLAWSRALPEAEGGLLILLGDPFSFPVGEFLSWVDRAGGGIRVVGGLASGGQAPRTNRLILDGETFDDGAVAIWLPPSVPVRIVISQGCRPIGRPLIVTRAESNVIRELGRRPALEVLREIFAELPEVDRLRVQQGLHLGTVINEYQETFDRGDFLVRNVIGADESGAIQITDVVRVGQTVQFHVRDAETADEDLREALRRERLKTTAVRNPAGVLLFSCNGRGTRLFDQPNHDVAVVRESLGAAPVAGFFAMGELGPVGGRNFVHGFTASLAIFEHPVAE